ncbi:anti-sigma B factor antagonist [Lipingzhangella halophila]|uniref:Anti-sigma factor antagonist n=1 Tax=Lipingzhangella halophila TaxID=1783352 RepID=A0A7W7RHH1_9ACTN|nr:STAS domain-containing protein [Lipingzhangella halophila]MBB4932029.1 anti-sigma B factor antagonist [Lipingzhangella halophila]
MSGRERERFECAEAVVVPVTGEIDIATAEGMRDQLLHAATRSHGACVVVDLSGVDFFDASAVRALMTVYRLLTRDGRHMVLAEPTDVVARTLQALGLDRILEIYPIVEMALMHARSARLTGGRRAAGPE